jgi:hypothetical protein
MRPSWGVYCKKNTMEKKLPNGKLIYVSALLSCTLFLFGGTAIIFAMSSFFLAIRSEKIYHQDPASYSNFSKIKKGKIISIIGIVLNLLILAVTIWTLYTIGWDAWSEEFVRKWNEGLQNSGR